jgi:hypothetical protein
MAIECSTVVRAFRATAHHVARRLAGHHVHHARRAGVHRVAALQTTKLPVVVCIAGGLATLGAGGFVAGDKMFGSSAPAPNEIGGTINPPLAFGASGVDSQRVGRLSNSPIASRPIGARSSPDTPFSYDWDEAGYPDTLSSFAWSEIGSPLDARLTTAWDEVGRLQGLTSVSWPNENSSILDTPSPPGAVPEPASVSVLATSLFGLAILRRHHRSRYSASASAPRGK